MGEKERAVARRVLRRHAFRLGSVRGRCRQIYRPRRGRHPAFSRIWLRGGSVSDEGTPRAGNRRRYALARYWRFQGLQGSLWMVAVGPLGPRARRQSRSGGGLGRDAGGGNSQDKGRDGRTGTVDGAGIGLANGFGFAILRWDGWQI